MRIRPKSPRIQTRQAISSFAKQPVQQAQRARQKAGTGLAGISRDTKVLQLARPPKNALATISKPPVMRYGMPIQQPTSGPGPTMKYGIRPVQDTGKPPLTPKYGIMPDNLGRAGDKGAFPTLERAVNMGKQTVENMFRDTMGQFKEAGQSGRFSDGVGRRMMDTLQDAYQTARDLIGEVIDFRENMPKAGFHD